MARRNPKPAPPAVKRPRAAASLRPRPAVPRWAAGLILVLAVFLAYWPATGGEFVWDDDQYVQNNAAVRAPDGLDDIWFNFRAVPQYYPLVFTGFWLEYRLWDGNPFGYHVVNIALHAGAALLLWQLLRRLEVPGAWVAAAVFALHPVHVESVAWITERKNVLSAVFYLLATLAYLRFALPRDQQERSSALLFYGISLLCFVAALLSKTVTCTLGPVLLLILWWKRRVRPVDLAALAPFWVLGVAFGLFTRWFEITHTGARGGQWDLSVLDRLVLAGRCLWFYAAKLVWPHPLVFVYPRWEVSAATWWQWLFPLAALGVLAALWVRRERWGRGPLVAVLCFAGTLFPALGFFDVYYMQYSFVADHWQYLASAALLALLVGLAARLLARGRGVPRGAVAAGAAIVVLALGARTWAQCYVYSDLERLWRETLARNPGAWMAHVNLASVLGAQGRSGEALEHCRRAAALNPGSAMVHSNLGAALKKAGQWDEALAEYRLALAADAKYPQAHYNLGLLLADQNRLDEAAAAYRAALDIHPQYAEAYVNLALLAIRQGRAQEAEQHARAAVRYGPHLPEAYINLGIALESQAQLAPALDAYTQALQLNPELIMPRFQLGVCLAKLNRLDEAIATLEDVLRRAPEHREARQALQVLRQQRSGSP